MKTVHELQQAMPLGLHTSQAQQALLRLARDLDRCLAWRKSGHMREAAAYNIDADNIVAKAIELRRQPDLQTALDSAGIADDATLDELARMHAMASAHAAAVAAWRSASVRDAGGEARLACLRLLRHLEPREQMWAAAVEEVEADVVAKWSPQVTQCIQEDELDAMIACRESLQQSGIGGTLGRSLLGELDDAITARQRKSAQGEVATLHKALHRAWMAMDESATSEILAELRAAQARAGIGDVPDDQLQSITLWLQDQSQERLARESHANTLGQLEQMLDEDRTVAEIETRYVIARESGLPMPTTLESRVAHRYQTARRRHRRRFALGTLAIAAMTTLAVMAVSMSLRSMRHQQTVERLVASIEGHLSAGRLDEASEAWTQAEQTELTNEPELAALSIQIEAARRQRRRDAATTAELIVQAGQAAHDAPDDLAALDHAMDLLEQAVALHIAGQADAVQDARSHITELKRAARERVRDQLHDSLRQAQDRLAKPAPGGGTSLEPRDWSDWIELSDVRSAIDRARRSPVGSDPDLKALLDSMESKFATRMERGQARLHSLEQANELLGRLAITPDNELAWARTWRQLLDNHIDVLAEGRPVEIWHRGYRGADAAQAVAHWRTHVRPAIDAVYGENNAATLTRLSRDAATSIRTHLDTHEGTPYYDTANATLPIMVAMSTTDHQSTLEEAITATNLLSLSRMPILKGGWIYVRPPTNTRTLRVIGDIETLRLPAHLIPPNQIDPTLGAIGMMQAVPASEALESHTSVPGTTSPAAHIDRTLRMVEAIEMIDEADLLLHLHTLEHAWLIAQDTLSSIAPKSFEPVSTWLDDLSTVAPAAAFADWPAEAPDATSTTQRRIRVQAATAIAQAPRTDAVRSAIATELATAAAARATHVPVGVLLPQGNRFEAIYPPDIDPGSLLVLTATGGRWQFTPVPLNRSGLVPEDGLDLPMTPAVLFSH